MQRSGVEEINQPVKGVVVRAIERKGALWRMPLGVASTLMGVGTVNPGAEPQGEKGNDKKRRQLIKMEKLENFYRIVFFS